MNKKIELIKAFIILPGTVLALVPGLILFTDRPIRYLFGLEFPAVLLLLGVGFFFTVIGVLGCFKTVSLFMTVGEGTPAPWAPPKRFVVSGPYCYVRNPMLLSVLFILIGGACFFGSWGIFIWCFLFWIISTFYLIYFEEPDLLKRFGQDYEVYKKNVKRWIPRWTPWTPR